MPDSKGVNSHFIARKAPKEKAVKEKEKAQPLAVVTKTQAEVIPPSPVVPDVFDPIRIKDDLQRYLTSPSLFDGYMARLRIRFRHKSEVQILDSWAHSENALALARLQAETAEQQLREAEAKYKKDHLAERMKSEAKQKDENEDEKQFEKAQSRRVRDIEFEIFNDIELAVRRHLSAAKAYRVHRLKVLDDKELTAREKDRILSQLQKLYRQKYGSVDEELFEE